MIDSVFTAGQLATPLAEAVGVDPRESPADAHGLLTTGRFDQAPVIDDKRVLGWVKTSRLADVATIAEATTLLSDTPIVAASTPVSQVLRLMRSGFVFTVLGQGLHGFITPSDLDRQAVRGHFYLLIMGVEMRLAELVQREVPEDAIVKAVLAKRDTQKRWLKAQETGLELRPVSYLYLRQLQDLFLKHIATGGDAWMAPALHRISLVRNTVMHPVKPMTDGESVMDLSSLEDSIDRMCSHMDSLKDATTTPGAPAPVTMSERADTIHT